MSRFPPALVEKVARAMATVSYGAECAWDDFELEAVAALEAAIPELEAAERVIKAARGALVIKKGWFDDLRGSLRAYDEARGKKG